MPGSRQDRSRGMVFPSPVVLLSIIVVAMAAVVFVATRGGDPTEREIASVVRDAPSATATEAPAEEKQQKKKKKDEKPEEPVIERGSVFVEVYNNAGIDGLAGRVGDTVNDAGWQVVGTDNWTGPIPTNTVYFPERLTDEGEQLALDLGIDRTAPAVGEMKLDRLTVILTSELD